MDSSLPGSLVHWIFQARILEWVAISFFTIYICMCVCVCVCVYCCCLVAKLCPTLLRPHGLKPTRLFYPWDFPRQDYWSGLPLPSPRDLPDPGIKPVSPELQADSLPLSRKGSPVCVCVWGGGRTRVHAHFIYFLLNLVTPEAPTLTNSHCSDP